MAQADYKRWLQETGHLHDQMVAAFYRALDEKDLRWLDENEIDVFGDNRPWSNTGL